MEDQNKVFDDLSIIPKPVVIFTKLKTYATFPLKSISDSPGLYLIRLDDF